MELPIMDYIDFISLLNSFWGWFALSLIFILIAHFRPFIALSLMCIYQTIPWSASWKPIITLYPAYPLILFLLLKLQKQILTALLEFRYRIGIILSIFIVLWSFLSTVLYSAPNSASFTIIGNPNLQRGTLMLSVLFFLPAILRTRDDVNNFILSSIKILIAIHVMAIPVAIIFLLSGHPLYELHRMRILETPPVYWESGLLLICLGYIFVLRKMSLIWLSLLVIISVSGLILGNSRTRILVTFFCLLYFIYPYISGRLFAYLITIIFILLAASYSLPAFQEYLVRLVSQRVEQSLDIDINKVTSGRSRGWAYTIQRWKESPLIGIGSCYIYPIEITLNNKAPDKHIHRAHNYYLEVLAGQGLLGLGLLMVVLCMAFIMMLKLGMMDAHEVIDGRLIVAFFMYGIINWGFKESWGITYYTIILLYTYMANRKDNNYDNDLTLCISESI